jgi:hypothetical protein
MIFHATREKFTNSTQMWRHMHTDMDCSGRATPRSGVKRMKSFERGKRSGDEEEEDEAEAYQNVRKAGQYINPSLRIKETIHKPVTRHKSDNT